MSKGKVKVRLFVTPSTYAALLRALRYYGKSTNKLASNIERNIKRQQQRKQRRASNEQASTH